MDLKTHLIGALNSNLGFVTSTLGDFTDTEMFARPCPGANHAAWQLGHITASEAGTQQVLAPAHAVVLPDGFKDVFTMKANTNDDADKFAPFNTKARLIELFTKVRQGTIACVESMPPEQLDAKSPEKYAMWAPTLGLLASSQVVHTLMHVGQFQVIRRKLGKPVLF
jgi:hypothetical protein